MSLVLKYAAILGGFFFVGYALMKLTVPTGQQMREVSLQEFTRVHQVHDPAPFSSCPQRLAPGLRAQLPEIAKANEERMEALKRAAYSKEPIWAMKDARKK